MSGSKYRWNWPSTTGEFKRTFCSPKGYRVYEYLDTANLVDGSRVSPNNKLKMAPMELTGNVRNRFVQAAVLLHMLDPVRGEATVYGS